MTANAQDDTFRHPAAGPMSGQVDENGALSWRGIPYARPPVGELRWKAPRPLAPFEQPLAATAYADMCAQQGQPMLGVDPSLYGKVVGNEDCLYLNIWSPPGNGTAEGARARWPVMVWLHGGSNVGGSGSLYYGGNLAVEQSVIVVTLNYRLGLFGWFSHPALRAAASAPLDRSPNFGTMDIIQALHWVRTNIAAFGGDPGNVTVFGESAGAMNALTLLYSPLARGLFHKAIMQSGSLRQTPVVVAEQHTDDDRSEFSSTETAAKILVQRRQASTREQAREAVARLSHGQFLDLMYGASGDELVGTYTADIGTAIRAPQIIPDDIVIPNGSPWELIADATRVQRLPMMIGSNRDEMKFFLGLDPAYVRIVPGAAIVIHNPERYDLHARYLSDRWTAQGVDELALRLGRHNPDIYIYRFDWDDQPSYPQADFRKFFGAAHSMELPFVFHDFDGMTLYSLHFTEQNRSEREELAAAMGEYWAQFAYSGEPGAGRSGRLPRWPSWDNGNKLILDAAGDGGIRPQRGLVTMKSLFDCFLADDSFPSEEDKADFRQRMFRGREAWESYFLPRLERQ
jgi:para-nitrobenzyl esterase